MSREHYKLIIEAALFASAEPLTVERLQQLFERDDVPTTAEIKDVLAELRADYETRGIHLQEVASGYRFQVDGQWAPWLHRLWEKKPPRYSRALLETLALIVYRQPITRGEIESIRGVAVNTEIMKKLQDHEWVKVVGCRDVPGKPALFGTTKKFLDHFNLKRLSDLPPLSEIVDLNKAEAKIAEEMEVLEEHTSEMHSEETISDTQNTPVT